MSGAAIGAALALTVIPLAGLPYALALDLHHPSGRAAVTAGSLDGVPLVVGAAWLLGGGLIAAAMLVLSILHVSYSRGTLGVVWLALAIGGVTLMGLSRHTSETRDQIGGSPAEGPYHEPPAAESDHVPWRRFRRAVAGGRPGGVPLILVLVLLAVCAFQGLYTFLQAIRVPLGSFDSWSLWEFKGRRFWLDGGITFGFLHDHAIVFAHPAYPPLLPLLIAWVYTWAGTPDPALMKPLYSLFYLALLLGFYAALQVRLGYRWALLATAVLTLIPRVTEYAGTGLADVPLAAYLVGAAAVAVGAGLGARNRCSGHEDRRLMTAAGILLGLAMCTKREGTLFFVAALCALILIERAPWRVARWLWPALLIGLPWYLYAGLTSIPDRDFLPATPANLLAHVERLGGIVRLFALNALAIDEWSILWFVFGAVLLLALSTRRVRAPALLVLIVMPLGLYVVSLSLSAWPDPQLHVRTSLDRLILVTVPFALWWICEQLLGNGLNYKDTEAQG